MFSLLYPLYALGKLNCAYMYTRKEDWDSINWFNPAIFAVQARTCISNVM